VKQVTNDFEQVAQDPRFKFLGNVAVGKDVTVPELLTHYNAVVLSYGAASDRTMGVPGEDLKHVVSARTFVNWYNGHPDFRDFKPNLEAEDVVIVGQGNVAIDCARILTKTVAELKETDISSHAVEALSRSKVKRVHVVGRRGHVQAAFTMKELREVTKLDEATCVVSSEELERGRTAASKQEAETQRARKRMDGLLTEVAAAAEKGPLKARQLVLRFLLNPSRALPSSADPSAVGALEFDVTRLEGPADKQSAVVTGQKEVIKAGMVLRSIGYKSVAIPDVPFDTRRHVVRNVKGRVTNEDGSVVPGLYTSGWLKRGPSGIIGTNITDARETVACLLEDKAGSKLPAGAGAGAGAGAAKPGMDGLIARLAARGKSGPSVVPWAGWLKIDAAEQARGKPLGKPREKITSVAEMLKAASA
jgi:adrenodoxin-NADP+ reductase